MSAADDAIARARTVSDALIEHRGALFPACEALLQIAGPDGLRACMAGVVEAVISAGKTYQLKGGVTR